jgi:hypothetical protein
MATSTFTPKDRLIRHQPRQTGQPERLRIPSAITPEDFLEITKILRVILKDIDDEIRALRGSACQEDELPKELHIRLNESDKPFALSLFAGWVESEDVQQTRRDWNHPDPGLHRFADDVYSEIYGEAINYANHPDPRQNFRYRDWAASELLEKRAGEKATDPKAGNTFQTCLAMVIDGLATGTLVVGFRRKPDQALLDKTHEVLEQWAREDRPKSPPERNSLINFLRKYEVGGPLLKDSNWWDLIPRPPVTPAP